MMGLLRRAFISIQGNRKKMLLYLLVVFLLGTIMGGGAIVRNAISEMERRLWDPIAPFAQVNRDIEAFNRGEIEHQVEMHLTTDLIQKIRELPYVKNVDLQHRIELLSSELRPLTENHLTVFEGNEQFRGFGVSESNFMLLREGAIQLREGRSFYESELLSSDLSLIPIIVSQEFLDINHLKLGSIIEFDKAFYHQEEIPNFFSGFSKNDLIFYDRYSFEIIGVFEASLGEEMEFWGSEPNHALNEHFIIPSSSWRGIDDIWFNQILDFQQVNELSFESVFPGEPEDYVSQRHNLYHIFELIFELNHPSQMPAFRETVNEMLPPGLTIMLPIPFLELLTPLAMFEWYAEIIFISAVTAGLVILSLLTLLILWDRKHEIGVYLALGEKKFRIYGQLLIEVLLTGITGFMAAFVFSYILASNLSQELLRQEIINSTEITSHRDATGLGMFWIHPPPLSIDEQVANFEIMLNFYTFGFFLLVGIGIIITSTLATTALILRKNPKYLLTIK